MGYTNPFYQYGLDRLAQDAAEAGVDGFLIPDLPSDESDEFLAPFAAQASISSFSGADQHRATNQGCRKPGDRFPLLCFAHRRNWRPRPIGGRTARVHGPCPRCDGFAFDHRLWHQDTGARRGSGRAGRWRGRGERIDRPSRYTAGRTTARRRACLHQRFGNGDAAPDEMM